MTRTVGAVVLAGVLVGCGGPGPDTPELRAELAARLAKIAAENGSFDRRLDRGADLALGATISPLELQLGRGVSDGERQRLWEMLRGTLAEFVSTAEWQEVVTGVYAAAFTAGELQAILDFYDSPLGHKLIAERGELDARVKQGTEALLEPRLPDFIERVDAELARQFPEVADQ